MFRTRRKKIALLSDSSLLAEFKVDADKKDFLSEIYMRYGHMVMGTSMKYLKNKQDAEDIAMIFFEKLPNKLMKHEIKHLKSWLYMVVKNECLMMLRKKGFNTSEHIVEPVATDEIALVIEKEEQYLQLESAIDELKPEQKECIRLFYLESKSYQEITTQLQLELKAVKSAIQNGKRNLKIKLEGTNEK